MTWMKIDYDDPSTLPEEYRRVLFVVNSGVRLICTGNREEAKWIDDDTNESAHYEWSRDEVTHWQPLPALPGEPLDPRTRLGMWLTDPEKGPGRKWWPFRFQTGTFCVWLEQHVGNDEEPLRHAGEGATLAEALEAALQKAGAP